LINIIRFIFLLGLGWVFSCSGTLKHIEPYTYKSDRRFQATIYRDTMGIPHIFGETDADAVFGLAYAHAEDDFKTIQDLLMGARGILASEYGPKLAPVDYYVHLIGVWDDINTRYEQEVSDDIKRICEAYAAGINKYASENKSERISRLFPLKGRDIIAGWMYQIPYLYGIERIIGKLFKEEKPAFSLLEKSLNGDMDPMNIDLIGSNVIGVSPQKSSDGHTRLLVNTHQPWTGPVAWYEAHMNSKEGINMVGGLFPGSPFVNHGHNPHLGWSFTSNSPDLVDVFELDINPE
jgi:Protein related to penicillin acylase